MHPVELSQMSAIPTAVYPNRCLLQRNSESECKYCMDACPNGAVKFDHRVPSVDSERCIGCGLCLIACPVECFETEEWTERSIVSALAHIGRQSVELACKSHPAAAVGNDARPVVQINTCLGAISPGLWFEIGLGYDVKIRLEYCSACPMGTGAIYTQRAVELANQWLRSCGRVRTSDGSITVQENCDDPDVSRRRVIISAERPIINRRDFLFGFARGSGPADLALKKLPVELGDAESNMVPPHVPTWLRRMVDVYPHLETGTASDPCQGIPPEECIHWPTLAIAESCAACRACSLNCPSGALVTKISDKKYEHIFTPGLCVACGLCAQVCPTESLSRSYSFDKRPFEERVMAERAVEHCIKCGRPAVQKSEHLCYCCSREPVVRSVLDSARNYLFHD